MAMPRQFVDGADDLDRFVAKLGMPARATWTAGCATGTCAGPART